MPKNDFGWLIFYWQSIITGPLQGSILGPLFFLIYIKNIPQRLSSEVKVFSDNTSSFSIINCVNVSALTLNSDPLEILGIPMENFIQSR